MKIFPRQIFQLAPKDFGPTRATETQQTWTGGRPPSNGTTYLPPLSTIPFRRLPYPANSGDPLPLRPPPSTPLLLLSLFHPVEPQTPPGETLARDPVFVRLEAFSEGIGARVRSWAGGRRILRPASSFASSAAPAPMAFDWGPVYNHVKDSIFTVLLTPSEQLADADMLKDIARAANTVEDVKHLNEILKSTVSTTGFSIGVRAGEIGILTCAHSLDHLFRASRPLSMHQICRLFTVRVLCTHHENGLLAAGNPPGEHIHYAVARVLSIDCRRDLMLVSTPLTSLLDCWGAQCLAPHPALAICPEGGLDPSTSECLLVSWPSRKPDLMTLGRISRSRRLPHFWQNDRCEYDFEALEVQMMVGKGSSGGPLVNTMGEVIGLLHGHDDTHSYFVSFCHVREFLPIIV